MLDTFGYVGSIMLAVCGAPQAYKSLVDKNSEGISLLFLLLWFFGELFLLVYSFQFNSMPLYLNYCFNIAVVSVILWYKIFPKLL